MIISTPRVTQLDAFLLDNELIQHLLTQLSHTLSSEHKAELSLLLRLILYKLTLWDKDQSYGMFLMNLKYEDLHKWKKLGYFSWVVFSGYANEKVSGKVYEEDDRQEQQQRWKSIWIKCQRLIKVCELGNYLVFLFKGDYPSLALRLLRVKIAVNSIELAKSNKGNVSYEFQNRQLVWNTFLEFIIFILPMFKTSGINSIFTKLLQKKPSKVPDQLEFKHLKERECPICLESLGEKQKITTPYQASCGDKYCYVCIVTKLELAKVSGEQWKCLRCGEPVQYAKPFEDVDRKAIKYELPYEDIKDEIKQDEDDEEEGEEPSDYDDNEMLNNEKDEQDDFDHDQFDEMDEEEAMDEDMYADDL